MSSVELPMISEASAGRAAAQFIVQSKGIGGAAIQQAEMQSGSRFALLAKYLKTDIIHSFPLRLDPNHGLFSNVKGLIVHAIQPCFCALALRVLPAEKLLYPKTELLESVAQRHNNTVMLDVLKLYVQIGHAALYGVVL